MLIICFNVYKFKRKKRITPATSYTKIYHRCCQKKIFSDKELFKKYKKNINYYRNQAKDSTEQTGNINEKIELIEDCFNKAGNTKTFEAARFIIVQYKGNQLSANNSLFHYKIFLENLLIDEPILIEKYGKPKTIFSLYKI